MTTAAAAAPPVGADPRMAPFYESLHRKGLGPGSGFISCCGPADCREVESHGPDRTANHLWEVYIGKKDFDNNPTAPDAWITVPEWMVDDGPTDYTRPAKAIACWYGAVSLYHSPGEKMPGDGHLICFIKPLPET